MTRLQDLLTQEAADLSTESDLAGALRTGRRRLLVRRAVAAGGATALVAVLAGSIVWATTSLTDRAEPAAPKPKLGVTLTIDDAVPAEEGTDYTAMRTVTGDADHIEINPFLNTTNMLLTEDGQALRRADEWERINTAGVMAVRAKFTLIDRETGDERELPVYDQWLQGPLLLGADKLYFGISQVQGEGEYEPGTELPTQQGQIAVFDRSTWTWSTLDWDIPDGFEWSTIAIGADDRAWLSGFRDDPEPEYQVWSGSLGDTSDARQETPPLAADAAATQVGSWLVWISTEGTVAVNTVDGAERTIQSVGECLVATRAGGSTPLLVSGEPCETADSRLRIRTLDGADVLELRGDQLRGMVTSERFVAVNQYTALEEGGGFSTTSYLYELATGKLMRMPGKVVTVEGDLAVLETTTGTGDDEQKEFTVIDLS